VTLTGLAIDTIACCQEGGAAPPAWPFGVQPSPGWGALQLIALLAAAVLLLAVGRALLSYYYTVASTQLLQEQMVVDLRAKVYGKLQRLSFRFYTAQPSGSLINRVTGDVQAVRSFVDGVILQLLIVVLSLGFCLAYMLRIDVRLTLLCLATTPAIWAISLAFCRTVRPAYHHNRELLDRLLLVLTENVRGMQVVKGFARHGEEIAKFRAANAAVQSQRRSIFGLLSLFSPCVEFLLSLNQLALLGYGGYLVIDDRLALGTGLIVFSGLLQQFYGQVTKMTNIINTVQESLAGAQRVFEVLDAPGETCNPPRARKLSRPKGLVKFDGVWFGHQPGRPVLREINLAVEPGQCVAILGPTGAGKTTLLSLIPRFYEATQGRVLVDGIDVRQLDLDGLRRSIGTVFQETFLFSDTVAANIAYGRPEASPEEVRRAARLAAADAFIAELPDGYDTVLCEGGKNLSGGQRQRLALARAILPQPPILLLDDPTAAVDAHTEREILADLQRAMAGRTTFLVAHRLSTLRFADLVVVLQEGRIVESGTHQELVARRGPYWQAAQLQNESGDEGSGLGLQGSAHNLEAACESS
jgi:ATP-binding cassette subfamily B protein